MKLATKLLIACSITSFIAITLIAYVIFSFTKTSMAEAIQSQQSQLARQTLDKIDRSLYKRYVDIQAIAGDGYLQEFLRNISQTTKLSVEQRVYPPTLVNRLKELSTLTGPWDDVTIVSREGTVVYALDKQQIGRKESEDEQHTAVFAQALAGKTATSDVYVSKAGRPTMLFAAPVRDQLDPSKKIIGVVVAHLSWQIISDIINSVSGVVVDLYDRQGLEIANNDDPEAIFKENNSDHSDVKAALAGEEKSRVTVGVDQEETVSSVALEKGFSSYRGKGWVLLIDQPTRIAFAPAAKAAERTTFIVVPIILIMNGTLLLFILRLLHPIHQLTQVTKEITRGDLSKRATISSRDEIGDLGLAFNDMAKRLQESYQFLERKVEEKTVALESKVKETERINKFMLGRELKMIELKNEIKKLQEQVDQKQHE